MNLRRLILLCAVTAPVLAGLLRAAGESPRRPNILYILADDMGWTAPSCFGNKDVATPNLDRLAAQGMKFTQAYAETQCSPTRAAFLSGQFGARTGVFRVTHEVQAPYTYLQEPKANTALQPEVATLAQTLRAAGYATGLSGKWHITPDYDAAPLRERDGGKYFDRYGFDYCGAADQNEPAGDKAVVAITDEIIGFIERNQARPWFAYVAHFSPHTRLLAPKALIENHAARGYKRTTAPNGRFLERPSAEYLAMLEHLDNNIGRLLARLDDLGLANDTLVVFTSDNGGLQVVTSNAPLRAGKGSPYEGGLRVPMMVRWPGKIAAGTVCTVPIHAIDYYPTFAELAGARVDPAHHLDGTSLLALWRGQVRTLSRDTLAWHMPSYTVGYGRAPCSVIRRGEWKLVHYFGDYIDVSVSNPGDRPPGKLVLGVRTELYNLRDDLGEQNDLAAKLPGKTAELKLALEAWWRSTGATFPTRNPAYDAVGWSTMPRPAAVEKKAND